MKLCKKCNEVQPLECFYRSPRYKDGLYVHCKLCERKRSLDYHRSDKGKEVEKEKKLSGKKRLNGAKYESSEKGKLASKRKYVKRKFNITLEAYDEYLSKPCAICGDASEVLDHCHSTNIIRGGLCQPCNKVLGFARDSSTRLTNAIKYLKNHKEKL